MVCHSSITCQDIHKVYVKSLPNPKTTVAKKPLRFFLNDPRVHAPTCSEMGPSHIFDAYIVVRLIFPEG
jgi:hypothetical protein